MPQDAWESLHGGSRKWFPEQSADPSFDERVAVWWRGYRIRTDGPAAALGTICADCAPWRSCPALQDRAGLSSEPVGPGEIRARLR
jgi:hypothetical protein